MVATLRCRFGECEERRIHKRLFIRELSMTWLGDPLHQCRRDAGGTGSPHGRQRWPWRVVKRRLEAKSIIWARTKRQRHAIQKLYVKWIPWGTGQARWSINFTTDSQTLYQTGASTSAARRDASSCSGFPPGRCAGSCPRTLPGLRRDGRPGSRIRIPVAPGAARAFFP